LDFFKNSLIFAGFARLRDLRAAGLDRQ
jgi:hypothetical protein